MHTQADRTEQPVDRDMAFLSLGCSSSSSAWPAAVPRQFHPDRRPRPSSSGYYLLEFSFLAQHPRQMAAHSLAQAAEALPSLEAHLAHIRWTVCLAHTGLPLRAQINAPGVSEGSPSAADGAISLFVLKLPQIQIWESGIWTILAGRRVANRQGATAQYLQHSWMLGCSNEGYNYVRYKPFLLKGTTLLQRCPTGKYSPQQLALIVRFCCSCFLLQPCVHTLPLRCQGWPQPQYSVLVVTREVFH